jgi:hypothetical protein
MAGNRPETIGGAGSYSRSSDSYTRPVASTHSASDDQVTSLDSQIAELKRSRRSMIEFVEWRPSPFYYLYVPLGTLLVYSLIGPPWWGVGHLAVTGFCFGILCYLPFLANQLRFWLFFRWPNERLHRRIASLEAQLDRRSAPGDRDA